MTGTADLGWIGYPPKVSQTQRILLSQVPEEDRGPLMASKVKREFTRSGEAVFNYADVTEWKRQQK